MKKIVLLGFLMIVLGFYLCQSRVSYYIDTRKTLGVKLPLIYEIKEKGNLMMMETSSDTRYGVVLKIKDCSNFYGQLQMSSSVISLDSMNIEYVTPFFFRQIGEDGILLAGKVKNDVAHYGLAYFDPESCLFYFDYSNL
ncbi:hypothetical protein [Fulvivirga sediminis]|uniref:Uncharacterized protein n=1 Tax=Fulvivirga sediminis TaxID=2803949 RepID=A0A937F7U2_9BACT|nr:hypothetical protein [Fulvivirga sediminis]MBL3656656.1 hypothetical protein [Fulvivirga sediminis]